MKTDHCPCNCARLERAEADLKEAVALLDDIQYRLVDPGDIENVGKLLARISAEVK